MRGVAVLGATDATDEMVGHLRHRQPLRQSKRHGLDIEVPGWLTGRAFDLEQLRIPGEIAESYRAIWWRWSPAALGLVSLPLHLDKLRKPDD
jgi:hypothetical protein